MPGEMYDTLLGQGISNDVALKLDDINQSGVLSVDELDDRAVEALKEFADEDAIKVLDQFNKSDLTHVQNKSAFLCGVMKTYRAKLKLQESAPASSSSAAAASSSDTKVPTGGPNEEKVKALLDRTGYTLDITTGQRKYGGPPPGWEGPSPGTGEKKFCSQVFIGKLPRDMFEDELVPLFEQHGVLYDLRIMVDPMSGLTKGFGFCTYTTKEGAQTAVKKLDGHEARPGKKLGVCLSQANNRLFVGSIPKSKTKQQIFDEFDTKVEQLTDVIVYISSEDKAKNRGFAFLEFASHKDAATARRKLMSGKMKVFGSISPTVDWADPVEEPDEEVMSKVKVVYVRNLSPAIEETKLNELFKQYGAVEKVKKLKDYAFIHFVNREDAMRAIEELDGQELDDLKIQVALAKPPSEKKERRGQSGFGALNVNKSGRGAPRGGPRGGRGMRGGFDPRAGAGRGRGGGYAGYGGYGYEEPAYVDYGYDDAYDQYYAAPPRPRGAPRGMLSRGGASRGGARGRGAMMRGAPRGAAGGRGMMRGAGAPKRKMLGGYDESPKRKYGADPWNPKPIAQQPLKQYYDDYSGGGQQQEWYQDSWN